jgi:ferric-dicitrate binding protein FerR (iron transport regulator)
MMRSETFQTPGRVRLDLELPAGSIEIETSNSDETHVELEALSDREQVREMVEDARIEATRRGDGHEVSVDVRTRHGVWLSFSKGPDIRIGSPELRLRISCPQGAELDVRTKSADLRARGDYGAVEFKTASGDMVLDHAAGDVHIKSASGDAHIDTVDGSLAVGSASGDLHVGSVAGETNVQLVSGDVHIRVAHDSINANTVSGDQRYSAVLKGRLDLRAISGDVIVAIARGARVFIDANTVSGSTSSEFELSDVPQEAPASEDSPLVEVYAKTVSGDVRIERAPAPAHA